MRKETLKVVSAFVEQRECKGRRTESTGKTLRLHGNKIAWRGKKGLHLTLAGFPTPTTRDRLNGLLELISAPLRFCQTKGQAVIRNLNTGEERPVGTREEITLPMLPSGDISLEARVEYAAEAVLMMRPPWASTPQGGQYWSLVYDDLKAHCPGFFDHHRSPFAKSVETLAAFLGDAILWSKLSKGVEYWAEVYANVLSLMPARKVPWVGPKLRPPVEPFRLTPEKLIKWLSRRGWSELGKGAYSTVLGKPGSDQVIKIGRKRDTWPEYVRWAKEAGYAGSFAPNVHAMKLYNKGEWYVARMDRLDGTVNDLRRSSSNAMTIAEHRYEISSVLRGRNKMQPEQSKSDNLEDRLNYVRGQFLEDKLPGIVKFARDFHDHFKTDDIDDHLANWMMKGDQVVLTDPLTDSERSLSPDVLRIKSTAKDTARLAA